MNEMVMRDQYRKEIEYTLGLKVDNQMDLLVNLCMKAHVKGWNYAVYAIRTDAKFWDGNPVTADDVVYSLSRNMDPKSGSIWGAFFSNVKSITKTGANEVTVSFSKPDELLCLGSDGQSCPFIIAHGRYGPRHPYEKTIDGVCRVFQPAV